MNIPELSLLSVSFWACCALTALAALLATFVSDVRRAAIALWIAGLGMGGVFLSLGAELLAVTQWIVSTLVVISFIFYMVMFGEYGVSDSRPLKKRLLEALTPVLIGSAFSAVVWLGAGKMHHDVIEIEASPARAVQQSTAAVGRRLTADNWIALEVIGLMLLLVVVGSGIVARPELEAKD